MCKDQPAMTSDMQQTPRSRRNGMGNIFDGIDPALYMRLGLSKTAEEEEEEKTSSGCSSEYEDEEQQQQQEQQQQELCLSEILGEMGGWARHAQQDKAGVACWEQLEILGCLQGSDATDPGCCGGDGSGPCRPRSLSCSLALDNACSSLAHRRRRNAMADLFSSLSPAQREALLALAAASSPAPAFPPTPVSPAVPPESAPQVTCS